MADARRDHRLVFVDLWASWCPPCMAMRASAFDDPKVIALADRFVWVAIDDDGAEGGELSKRWGLESLPVVLVLDPEAPPSSALRARWSTTSLAGAEVAALLEAVAPSPLPEGTVDVFSATVVLRAQDDAGRAARARADALLEHLPASSPLAPFLVEELVWEAKGRKDFERCAKLAEGWSDRLPAGGLAVNVAFNGHECAKHTSPPRLESARHQLDLVQTTLQDPHAPILPFTRGYASYTLRALRLEEKDPSRADEVTERWLAIAQEQSSRGSLAQRASLSAPLEFWLDRFNDYARGATSLCDIARASPGDGDALRRAAEALGVAGRVDEGIAAIEHGAAAVPVERRLPVLWQETELLRKKKDAATEASALDAALLLPPAAYASRSSAALRAKMKERREELRKAARDAK